MDVVLVDVRDVVLVDVRELVDDGDVVVLVELLAMEPRGEHTAPIPAEVLNGSFAVPAETSNCVLES